MEGTRRFVPLATTLNYMLNGWYMFSAPQHKHEWVDALLTAPCALLLGWVCWNGSVWTDCQWSETFSIVHYFRYSETEIKKWEMSLNPFPGSWGSTTFFQVVRHCFWSRHQNRLVYSGLFKVSPSSLIMLYSFSLVSTDCCTCFLFWASDIMINVQTFRSPSVEIAFWGSPRYNRKGTLLKGTLSFPNLLILESMKQKSLVEHESSIFIFMEQKCEICKMSTISSI